MCLRYSPDGYIKIDWFDLLEGGFAAATVLVRIHNYVFIDLDTSKNVSTLDFQVTFGVVIGKTTPMQLLGKSFQNQS